MNSCNHNLKQTLTTFSSCEFESIDKIITRGGYADLVCGVLKVVRPRKKVAVKAYRRVSPAQDKVTIENELGIWQLLCTHPHIASFIGIAPVDNYNPRYLSQGPVSDYYIHGDLNMYLYKVDPNVTDHQMRFKLLLGVIRGLAYIHAQSVVHGDLKAGNVLVDGDLYVARICDFGSARIECACYSGPEEQEGTMAWDSPELWMRNEDTESEEDDEEAIRPRTQKSDVWAFGCVALEVQMGTTPWDPQHEGNLRKMRMRQFKAGAGHPANESDLELDNSPTMKEVWKLIEQCWRVDPLRRISATELLDACKRLEDTHD
ncbi:tyrosine kinase catalytic domain protein [Rhizoctonia solani AG-3 Rhs1AP]|uniref:Tyrosine kinase catalytic domain protein n=2 Tax=Rhizoctonia solani AG-3 TaxID=1086053 RepID=A0A074RP50_9AGAM|nr:tyrosine kinase catalytic domain protein [Rhizoctonia solani AG-3 Rhs1AP]KEP46468.1 tyrosine kinase catalytic domain protein [Rhizoctonia solani 123E]